MKVPKRDTWSHFVDNKKKSTLDWYLAPPVSLLSFSYPPPCLISVSLLSYMQHKPLDS